MKLAYMPPIAHYAQPSYTHLLAVNCKLPLHVSVKIDILTPAISGKYKNRGE